MPPSNSLAEGRQIKERRSFRAVRHLKNEPIRADGHQPCSIFKNEAFFFPPPFADLDASDFAGDGKLRAGGSPTAHATTAKAQTQFLQLDQIISEAPDLDSFLRNPDLINRYFKALQNYYGDDKFPREKFDGVLGQLRKLVQDVPKLKTRLWEKTNLGTGFEITTNFKTSGRSLDYSAWITYKQNWLENILHQQNVFTNLSEDEVHQILEKTFSDLTMERTQFEEGLTGLSKNAAGIALGNFVKSQRERPEVKQASAYLLQRYLTSPRAEQAFQTYDADIILDFLEQLKRRSLDVLSLPEEVPAAVLSELQQMVPNNVDLLENKEMFPYETKKARNGNVIPVGSTGAKTYSFDPLPRRIHGIWKGISIGECVGGGDVENLTPERWATVALKNTQLYHLHEGNSYLGFIQIVPIQKDGKTYGSVDFGAGALTRKVLLQDERTRMINLTSLFDLWFLKARKLIPSDWSGLVVGSGQSINNAGVLGLVQQSSKYTLGKRIGESEDFENSGLAGKIVKNSPTSSSVIQRYGGRMIFDGMVKDAGTLHLLTNFDPNFFSNPRKILAALTNAQPAFQQKVLQDYNSNNPSIEDSQILKALLNLTKSEDSAVRDSAMQLLINNKSTAPTVNAQKAQLAQSGLLPTYMLMKYLDQVVATKNYAPEIADSLLSLVSDPQIAAGTSEEARSYVVTAGLPPERVRKILDIAYRQRFLQASFGVFFLQQNVDDSFKKELCTYMFKIATNDIYIKDVFVAYAQIEKNPEVLKNSLRLLVQSEFNYANSKFQPERPPLLTRDWLSSSMNEADRKNLLISLAPQASSMAGRAFLTTLMSQTDFNASELHKVLELNPRLFQNSEIVDQALAKIPRPSITVLDAAFLTYISEGYRADDLQNKLRSIMIPTSAEEEARIDQLLIWAFTNASKESLKIWNTVNGIADFIGTNGYRVPTPAQDQILKYVASIGKDDHLYASVQRLAKQVKDNPRGKPMFAQPPFGLQKPAVAPISCERLFL